MSLKLHRLTLLVMIAASAHALSAAPAQAAIPSTENSEAIQSYEILKGDTLWGISKRLFGDPFGWPKIWALNGGKIPNPHLIHPSTVLQINPGSATSLPSVSLQAEAGAAGKEETATDAPAPKVRATKLRSREWQNLPQQPWEPAEIQLPKNVDAQGFDLRARYVIPRTQGFELPWIAASDELPELGKIELSQSDSRFITLQDIVYIDSNVALEVNKIYTLSREPAKLSASLFGRSGLAYPVLGRVKIVGKKEDTWIGQIIQADAPIEREDSFLIQDQGRVHPREPVAAPSPVEATFITERGSAVKFAAQFKIAFIDRGINDGISEGMILRAYQKEDTYREKTIAGGQAVVAADVQVLQATERFSTVMVLRSLGRTIEHGTELVALTDVSDLNQQKLNISKEIDLDTPTTAPDLNTEAPKNGPEAAPQEAEALDQLEEKTPLTEEEQKNLEQLEKEGQSEPTEPSLESELETAPEPSPSPTPSDSPAEETPAEEPAP